MTIPTNQGWVFVTRDERQVLRAEYDPEDWHQPEDYQHANGWTVVTLSGCCGSTIFPEYIP